MAVKSVTSTSELRLQLEVPPGISIALDLSEGRGIVSTQTFPKGSEIFTGLPFCHAVRTNRHDDICTSCLSLSSTCELFRCSNCKFNHYCSKACQRKDWPIHKGECVGMAAILPAQPTGTIRLALRLMMKKKAHLGKKSKDSFWPVDLLYEYGKHLPTSTKKADYPEFDLIQLMCKRNKHIHVCDKHEVFSLLDRLVHNAFYLLNMDLAMNINGEGLYILPSFLNHSCQPNCTVLFDGLRMSVRSLQDIEPGQQLYITYYSDLHAHPNERQESLKNRYHFNCQCRRCSLKLCLDPLLISILCTKCQKVVVNAEKLPSSLDISLCTCGEFTMGDVAAVSVQEMSEEFSHLTEKGIAKDKGMLESLTTLQTRATKVLSPYHELSIRIIEKIFKLASDLHEFELAFQAGRSLMPLYELYLETSPIYTLQLVKLFILVVSQDMRDSEINKRKEESSNHPRSISFAFYAYTTDGRAGRVNCSTHNSRELTQSYRQVVIAVQSSFSTHGIASHIIPKCYQSLNTVM